MRRCCLCYSRYFDSVGVFICILNNIVFMLTLLLFFWFIISKQFETVILSKVDILVLVLKENKELKKKIIDQIYKEYNNTKLISIDNEFHRNEYNFELLKNKIGPFIYSFFSILCSLFGYIVYKRIKFDIIDFILVLSVIFAFSTEIVFYYVLLNNWIFIGDNSVLKYLFGL
jgi:hypothetical protein